MWFSLLVAMLILHDCESTLVTASRTRTTRRGALIGNGDTIDDISRIYHDKLAEYREKAFFGTDWQTLRKTSDDIEVAILTSEDDKNCPYVRFRAIIPTSATKLYKFMDFSNWKIFMPIINPFYQTMNVMKEYKHGNSRIVMARKLSTRILGFGRRDFSLLSIVKDDSNNNANDDGGVLVSGTISVIAPQQIPRYEGFTRAYQDLVCFYNPLGADRTELTIILRTDLNDSADGGTGGSVPMWLVVKTLGIAGSKAMKGLRKVVSKHV